MKRTDLIAEFADIIRREYSIKYPIKNIEKLVKSMGGEVKTVQGYYDLPRVIIEGDRFSIEVSQSDSKLRRQYTIACGIGQLFFKYGYKYGQVVHNETDKAVHDFALALLMPERELYWHLDDMDDAHINIIELSEYFRVPVNNVIHRCKQLNLIEYQ